MLEPKVPVIGASVGFVLSFLIGLVNGASFPALLIRAFFMALLFGALVALARIAINKFLPELLGESSTETSPEENSGNAVNITIGDNAKDEFSFDESDTNENAGLVPDFLEAEDADVPEKGNYPTGAPERSEPAPVMQEKRDDPGESHGSAVPVQEKTVSGGLDVLPDLQDFIPQKKPEPGDDGNDAETMTSIGSQDSIFVDSDTSGVSAEAETMAKAIRTILSRDN